MHAGDRRCVACRSPARPFADGSSDQAMKQRGTADPH
jgi:hypothetical protein